MTPLEQLEECKKAVEQITLRQNDCWYDTKTIATAVYVILLHMIAEQTEPKVETMSCQECKWWSPIKRKCTITEASECAYEPIPII